jgi:hypothetical protein
VSSYTAALIADTAVPAWHEAHRELPFLFVGSAAAASGGFGLVAAPLSENEPARRMAALGAIAELVASEVMDRRLGTVAEALQTGTAGRRLRIAKALTAAGALVAATPRPQPSSCGGRRSGAAGRLGPHPLRALRRRHGIRP